MQALKSTIQKALSKEGAWNNEGNNFHNDPKALDRFLVDTEEESLKSFDKLLKDGKHTDTQE